MIGPTVRELSQRLRHSVVNFAQAGRLFEDLGITYIGSMPGHDLRALLSTFSQALELKGPVIVHVRTQKGRGFQPAETDQIGFHGAALPPMSVPAAGNGNGAAAAAWRRPRPRRVDADRVDGRRRGATNGDRRPRRSTRTTRPSSPRNSSSWRGPIAGSSGSRPACRPAPGCRSSRRRSRTDSSTSGLPSSTRWRSRRDSRWAGCGRSSRSTRRSSSGRSTRPSTTSARTTSPCSSPSTGPASSGRTGRATRACSRSRPSASSRTS